MEIREDSKRKTQAVQWLVNEVIRSRGWEETQAPKNTIKPIRTDHSKLCPECEMNDNLKRTSGFQELLAECAGAHSGSVISVPSFEISIGRDSQGVESYTVELSAKKYNK